MQDYAGNSKKEKLAEATKPEKKIDKVTTSDVLVKKKSVGSKFKDLFIMADFRTVFSYVVTDVLLPAARNMIVDGASKGVERMMYGDRAVRSRGPGYRGPVVTYNSNILNRGAPRDIPYRSAPALNPGPRSRSVRDDFILSSREDAERVLEHMSDIIDQYEVVSIADYNELVGYPVQPVDNKWGWTFIGDTQIQQIREGYLINLPPAEPIA